MTRSFAVEKNGGCRGRFHVPFRSRLCPGIGDQGSGIGNGSYSKAVAPQGSSPADDDHVVHSRVAPLSLVVLLGTVGLVSPIRKPMGTSESSGILAGRTAAAHALIHRDRHRHGGWIRSPMSCPKRLRPRRARWPAKYRRRCDSPARACIGNAQWHSSAAAGHRQPHPGRSPQNDFPIADIVDRFDRHLR